MNYNNPGLPNDFGNLTVSFSGRDTGFWGGYYGPQVRNVSLKMRYGVDTCAADPLSATTCSGYAAAYLALQCSGNALYSPQCPGYAQAYFTQQCTVNALYDPINNAQRIHYTTLVVQDMIKRILHNNALLMDCTQRLVLIMLQLTPRKCSSNNKD